MMVDARLQKSVQYLKGVGPRRAERFAKLGVETARDLLYHVPHRYEDATTVRAAATLVQGEDATIIGRVVTKGVLSTRSRLRIFRAVLRDQSGVIECAWPGQPWLDRQIGKGDLLLVTGTVGFYHGPQLRPREYTVLSTGDEVEGEQGRVFPVYSATEGLGHRQIRKIVDENIEALLPELADAEPFPSDWRAELGLPSLDRAIFALHRPGSMDEIEPARRRLAYEELFFLQLLHARARASRRAEPGLAMPARGAAGLAERFIGSLPFRLTSAQRRVWTELSADMTSSERMYRLLHGDVGSGKTVVAAAAMLRAIENEAQAVLMAPTELLAEQHAATLGEWFSPLGVELTLLTGKLTASQRDAALEGLRSGEVRAVVGTQALIQDAVEFARAGLVVIDEQHRFGVDQRRALAETGERADVLVMSATPIPRSLALALYGDLDVSALDEMPPGRRPVVTAVRPYGARAAALDWLEKRLAEGRQAYVVYPLIEESDAIEAAAATQGHEELTARFSGARVELLHGRMSAVERDDVMRAFLEGDVDVLVSTTVIEVGIDVANATVMLIEHAERFGLAQLHQLRGRVGRGSEQSWCIAFHAGEQAPERLRAFAATTDGFRIASEDLRLRGQGDLFGAAQHGVPGLRHADLSKDLDLLEHARRRARELVEGDPELSRPFSRRFARIIAERYAERERRFGIG